MKESEFIGRSELRGDEDQVSAKMMLEREGIEGFIRNTDPEPRKNLYLMVLASDIFIHLINKFNGDKLDAVKHIFQELYQICMSKFDLGVPMFGDVAIDEGDEQIIASITIQRQKINFIMRLILLFARDRKDITISETQINAEQFILLCDIVFYLSNKIEGDNSDAVKSVLLKIHEICKVRMSQSELDDAALFDLFYRKFMSGFFNS